MKPFISIDITENKKNDKINGEEFVVKTVSQMQKQFFENAQEDALGLVEEAKMPLLLRIIQGGCGIVSLMIVAGIVKAWAPEDGLTIAQCYQNAPALFWIAGACLVVWAILKFLSTKKQKETLETDMSENTIRTLDTISKNIYAELDVPENALAVDILGFTYKMKDGEPKAKETGLNITPYLNIEFKAFTEENNLILADLENKYSIPLSSLRSIHTVRKSIRMPSWNKDEPHNKGKYKEYKLNADDYGCIHVKPYHILEFSHNGENWGIYFPSYELSVFEELTGLKAE